MLVLSCGALATCGCGKTQGKVGESEPLAIPVSHPVRRQVTDYVDFTGQTAAMQSVTIVPRVTGYLVNEPFKEGAEVKGPQKGKPGEKEKPGDLLFEVDPRPYKAQFDQANGQVTLNQARLRESQADNARAKALAKTPGAISQQDLDRYQAAEEEAEASLQAAKASLEVFKLNLSFCNVTSPIDGQVSRYFLTPGNLVNQDQTQLTTVVSLDPMYVYFEMDEVTLQVIRKARDEGKIKPFETGEFPVEIGLQSEVGYPHPGTVDFFNNQVNSTTGSITVRGIIKNPTPKNGGHRLLSPGMFVRVHLPIGQPHSALLVIDRAIGSDQNLKYIYTMGADNKIQQRTVQTGVLEPDGLRVIEPTGKKSDLTEKDWVVVGGILQVRPNMVITPDKLDKMPSLDSSGDGDSSSASPAASTSSGAATDKPTSPAAGAQKPSGEKAPSEKAPTEKTNR
jgi:membrane fusion protein, multidrug efflux system